MGSVLSKPSRWAHVHNNTEIMHACYSSSSAAAVGARLKNRAHMCARWLKEGLTYLHKPPMTSFSVFLKCCKEGTFWAGTMKYSMLPLFSPAPAPRFFLYFIDLKTKASLSHVRSRAARILLISGMSAWDECWVVRLLYSSSWWGSLVVCVWLSLALFPSLLLHVCVRVCVCSWSDVFQGGKQLVGITHTHSPAAQPKCLLPPNGRTCM